MSDTPISHALVLPDNNFKDWYNAAKPYIQKFSNVAVVRSPAGNDLNRFRNVTAVEAPATWFQDDAHAHIRRIYPMVVRVDVIRVLTPFQLQAMLNTRVQDNDRYGEKLNFNEHIFDRFILEYPTDHRPMQIVRRYSETQPLHEGVDIASRRGAKVLAGAAGRVTTVWESDQPDRYGYGNKVQVTTVHNRWSTYLVTYIGLRNIKVREGQNVAAGDLLAEADGDSFKIIVQMPPHGTDVFRIANIVDPTPMFYVQDIRVRPIVENLRVRTLPSTQGNIIRTIDPWEQFEVLSPHGRVLWRAGSAADENQWLKIKLPDGTEGYAAGWLLQTTTRAEKREVFPGVNPVGVNLDALHPLGTPEPNRLGEMGWVRFGYNVSSNIGSTDLVAAFNRYRPLAEQYKRAGYKVVFTTSHQTYGEGIRDFWPWNQMTDEKWNRLIAVLNDMMAKIAQQWVLTGLVDVWQIWNEQDAGPNATSSAPMAAHNYAKLLRGSIQAIRSVDPNVTIITGGHTGGPGSGAAYAAQVINSLPANLRPDGVALHPYGRGIFPGPPYAPFGHIDESIEAYSKVMPGKPLWITEWGVLDRNSDPPEYIMKYATDFIRYLKRTYPDKVAVMIWYAWAESMHNGYGLVDRLSNPRSPLYEKFIQA